MLEKGLHFFFYPESKDFMWVWGLILVVIAAAVLIMCLVPEPKGPKQTESLQCLGDTDCPSGQACQTFGNVSRCLPTVLPFPA